jgi:hypothetical protein
VCTLSLYLLYWYKSTNTDAAEEAGERRVYLLYWYKSTNSEAAEGAGERRVPDAQRRLYRRLLVVSYLNA